MDISTRLFRSFAFRLSRKMEQKPFFLSLYKRFCFTFLNPKNLSHTPIFINNRNRYTYLKDLVDWLQLNGFTNFYIIDNKSSYPPLLEYYNKELKGRVIFLNKNSGHLAFWNEWIIEKFKNSFYVYTDSDVLPVLKNNPDFLKTLYHKLKKYPFAIKVGSALKMDDLPECFLNKSDVVNHEQQFWRSQLEENVFHANVDTTLALYLPNFIWETGYKGWNNHLRIAGDCTVSHQPWYEDSNNLSEEQLFYQMHSRTTTHWTNYKATE